MPDKLKERTPFKPAPGVIFENAGGGKFLCIKVWDSFNNCAWFTNVKSGWTFLAHGCGLYPDGSIDWDYSTDGFFDRPPELDARGARA